MPLKKEDLAFALQTRVLTDEETEQVKKHGGLFFSLLMALHTTKKTLMLITQMHFCLKGC